MQFGQAAHPDAARRAERRARLLAAAKRRSNRHTRLDSLSAAARAADEGGKAEVGVSIQAGGQASLPMPAISSAQVLLHHSVLHLLCGLFQNQSHPSSPLLIPSCSSSSVRERLQDPTVGGGLGLGLPAWAAADPLNGQPMLMPDPDHPGWRGLTWLEGINTFREEYQYKNNRSAFIPSTGSPC